MMSFIRDVKGKIKTFFTILRGDTAVAVLESENRALGVIEGTTSVYPGFYPSFDERLRIYGENKSACIEGKNCYQGV